MGRGWVWGSGRGVVTVRFETAETPAGPVRSYADDDPALHPWRPDAEAGEADPVNCVADGPRHGLASLFVEIRELDADALADDAVMRDFYDLNRRAELLGREQAPFWTLRGVPRRASARPTAASGRSCSRPTTATGWSAPPCCGRSCSTTPTRPGSRSTSTCRTAGAASAGRWSSGSSSSPRPTAGRLLMTDAKLPVRRARDPRLPAGSPRRAATSCPTTRWSATCALPVPDEQIQEWIDEAAPHHEGYTIETFVDEVPDDLVESLCVLLGQLAVDAPTGAVDFEEEVDDARAVRGDRRHRQGDGPGSLRDGGAHPGPPGRRPVDAGRAARGQHRRLPVGHVRAPRAPRPQARPGHQGGQPPRGPGARATT